MPCEVWFHLLLDHFLATFSLFLRLLYILQIYKVQPYFRTFVPTGPSLMISLLLQVSPSPTFFYFRKFYSTPGLGRSPGEGKGYPLQYSGLEDSMDYMQSRTRLSNFHFDSSIRVPAKMWFPQRNASSPSPCPKADPHFVLPQSIFYFSCIAVTRIVVKLFAYLKSIFLGSQKCAWGQKLMSLLVSMRHMVGTQCIFLNSCRCS